MADQEKCIRAWFKTDSAFFWLTIILFSRVLLSLHAFVGWGLATDDSYYAQTAYEISKGHLPNLLFGSNYRFGLHFPNALSFWVFGVSDASFVLFSTLCSLATIVVTYFIGKEVAGYRAGLLSAALLAFSPFDVVFSTTMTTDILVSFFSALSFLLFFKADRTEGPSSHRLFVLAGAAVFYSYLIKITAIATLAIFSTLSLLRFGAWKRHVVFYLTVAGLIAGFCFFDYFSTGGFFNYFIRDALSGPQYVAGLGSISHYLSWYPRWMFKLTFDQTLLFGYTFYAALPALVYVLLRRLRTCLPLIVWLVGLFLVLEFLPATLGLPYQPIGRFFRYLDALVVPSCLLTGVLIDSIFNRSRWLGGLVLAFLLLSSVVWVHRTASMYQDSFGDQKSASAFLTKLPEADIYSDNFFLDRFWFDGSYRNTARLKRMQETLEQRRNSNLLASFGPGYAVTGGARGMGISLGAIFNLGSLKPPPNWHLLKTIDKEAELWRQEPLRIYRIEGTSPGKGKRQSR